MPVGLGDVLRPAPNVTARIVGGEAFVMHLVSLRTFSLNETSTAVWLLADGIRSAGGIITALMDEYEVGEAECRQTVLDLLDRLVEEDLLVLAGSHD